MNTFSKISEFQFGSKQTIIINNNLNYFTKNITNNLENKLFSAILSIDICKA